MIGRYEDKHIKELWSDTEKYRVWYEIEIYVAEATRTLWGVKKPLEWESIDFEDNKVLQRIKNIEKETKHDVAAFITYVCEMNPDNARYVHATMTSSDLVDTYMSYCIRYSLSYVAELLHSLELRLRSKAIEHKYVKILGRTHGKHATPTMLPHKLSVHIDIINDCYNKMTSIMNTMRVKLSGPVGIGSVLLSDEENRKKLVKDLYLRDNAPYPAKNDYKHDSQVIHRAWYFDAIAQVFKTSSVLNSLATDLRLLAQEEIGEFVIGRSENQWGSSSMPHKVNPVKLERVCGMSRLVKGYFNAFTENMTLWNERDISNSSVERIALPDMFHAVVLQIKDLKDVLKQGRFDVEKMRENLLNASIAVYSNYLVYQLCRKSKKIGYCKAVAKARKLLNTKYASFKVKDSFHEMLDSDQFIRAVRTLTEKGWVIW